MSAESAHATQKRRPNRVWQDVLAFSDGVLADRHQETSRSPQVADVMLAHLEPLAARLPNAFTLARLYADGRAACGLAVRLVDEDRRRAFVQGLGEGYARAERAEGGAVRIDEITRHRNVTGFQKLAQAGHNDLSAAEQLGSDGLVYVHQRLVAAQLHALPESDRPVGFDYAAEIEKAREQFLKGEIAATMLAEEGLFAATTLWRLAGRRMDDYRHGKPGAYDPENPPNTTSLAELIAAVGEASLAVDDLGMSAARMHMTHLVANIGKATSVGPNGVVAFDSNIARAEPVPASVAAYAIHDTPLACPASTVSVEMPAGTAGASPTVVGLIPLVNKAVLDGIRYGDELLSHAG